jgi:hypothetical protein
MVVIALAIVALFAFAALALDGGRLYAEQRQAQNAADNAALAGVLAMCSSQNDYISRSFLVANQNGYDNNGTTNAVMVNNPPSSGPNAGKNEYIEVIVNSEIGSTLIHLVMSDPLQVNARAVALCDLVGTPFTGGSGDWYPYAVFAGSTTCTDPVNWSGNLNTVIGGIHSNNNYEQPGNNNTVIGQVTYEGNNTQMGSNNTFNGNPPSSSNPQDNDTVEPWPATYNFIDYTPGNVKAVKAAGAYHSSGEELTLNKMQTLGWITCSSGTCTIEEGLYYTPKKIDLQANYLIGTVTLVSGDTVTLAGNDHDLWPYMDGLLIFSNKGDPGCNTEAVRLNGNNHDWGGIIYAPNGMIRLDGNMSGSVISGCLVGYTARLDANEVLIRCDSQWYNMINPTVSLIE